MFEKKKKKEMRKRTTVDQSRMMRGIEKMKSQIFSLSVNMMAFKGQMRL